MAFISVTRLRIRAIRFLPAFIRDAARTRRQISHASGFEGGRLLADRAWTFWTLTAWDGPESMRGYMMSGAHKASMPHLLDWCDEASVVHWHQADARLPTWTEADARMRQEGRASKLRNPSPRHAGLEYRPPRTFFTAPIRPAAPP